MMPFWHTLSWTENKDNISLKCLNGLSCTVFNWIIKKKKLTSYHIPFYWHLRECPNFWGNCYCKDHYMTLTLTHLLPCKCKTILKRRTIGIPPTSSSCWSLFKNTTCIFNPWRPGFVVSLLSHTNKYIFKNLYFEM